MGRRTDEINKHDVDVECRYSPTTRNSPSFLSFSILSSILTVNEYVSFQVDGAVKNASS